MKTAYSTTGFVLIIIIGAFFLLQQEESDIIETMEEEKMTLASVALEPNSTIPELYTCDGDNISPPFTFSGVPESTVSLALLMDDPDIPEVFKTSRGIEKFDHWAIFNLQSSTVKLDENYGGIAVSGVNSAGDSKYTGPCPPTEYEPTEHRYIFQLYALDSKLGLSEGVTQKEIRAAMKGHIIQKAELIGLYDRSK